MTPADVWQARVYRAMLVCYPHEFRQEYAREMCLSFVDDCRAQASWLGVAGVWSRALADVALDAPKERLRMWWQDVRYGLRMLWKDRLTTLTAVVVLALGIGATTTVFTLVNGVLLRPLPYYEADRLVMIDELSPTREPALMGMAFPNYLDLRARVRTVRDLALYDAGEPTVRDESGAERVPGANVSDGLWRMLGVSPIVGRVFTREEDTAKHPLVAVISYELWQRRFGGSRDVLTRAVNIAGEPATIVGVMPPGFHFPSRAELWLPIRGTVDRVSRQSYSHQAIARLAPGATVDQAERELTGLIRQVITAHPEAEFGQVAKVRPFHDALTSDYRRATLLLLAAVGLVLLIACANVANLLLVKASIRGREMALRGALGAPRRRLIRQLLVESLLLGLLGAAAGLVVALGALPAMLALIPTELPRWIHFEPDLRVLGFVSVTAVLSGLCVGVVPALTASRQNLVEVLNDGGRGRTASPRQRAIRDALIVAEVALSMVLLMGAALMARGFLDISQQRLGFDAAQVFMFRTSVPTTYDDDAKVIEVARRIREEIAALPGVTSAAAGANVPLVGAWGMSLTVEGRPPLTLRDAPMINHNVVTSGYFRTLGVPIVEGRDFTESDGAEPRVTIVDEALARYYWPGQSALGKRIRFGPPENNPPWHTIVGVVGRVHSQSLTEPERWDAYRPYKAHLITAMRYVVRTSGDPTPVLPLVRARVAEIDRGIAIANLRRLDGIVSESIWRPRFFTILMVAFAGVALLLALVGLYGMVSYSIAQRTHELGVRAALGATARSLRWTMTAQGLRLALMGIVLGGCASLALHRLLATQLFEVGAPDAWLLAATAAALVVVAAAASYWPARHATKVDPVSVLRE